MATRGCTAPHPPLRGTLSPRMRSEGPRSRAFSPRAERRWPWATPSGTRDLDQEPSPRVRREGGPPSGTRDLDRGPSPRVRGEGGPERLRAERGGVEGPDEGR